MHPSPRSMPFLGSVNQDTRSLIVERAPLWKDLDVFVCCSGAFTVERILSSRVKSVHGNDVSLYTSVMGAYLAGDDFRLDVADPDFKWLQEWCAPGPGRIATIMLSSEMLKFRKSTRFQQRQLAAYREQWPLIHAKTTAKVEAALGHIRLASFTSGDVIDYMREAPKEAAMIGFPPTYGGGYERMFKDLDAVFDWDRPTYQMFDDGRFATFTELLQDREHWMTLRDHAVPDLDKFLVGCVQTSITQKPVYIYASDGGPVKVTKPSAGNLEQVPARRASTLPLPPGPLKIVHLSGLQLNMLRSEYLAKSILQGPVKSAVGVMIGDHLVGAIGIGSDTEPVFSWCDMLVISDFAVPSEIPHLSKLILAAVTSKECQLIAQRIQNIRVRTFGTVVFSKKAISMKYRGAGWKLVSRRTDPARLMYSAPAGQRTLAEAYEWWKGKVGL